jgi:phosphoserine phosphatase RsbU/P
LLAGLFVCAMTSSNTDTAISLEVLSAGLSAELRTLVRTLPPDKRSALLDEMTVLEMARPDIALPALTRLIGKISTMVSEQQLKMLKVMKEVQAAADNRIKLAGLQKELDVAARMQLSILPRVTPDHPNIAIASQMIPAKEIGGDFYDYFVLDSDHLGLVVADVSGKGIPAAFFMAISRTLLKARARLRQSISETIASINDDLAAENEQVMFVTLFYGVLELSTGKFIYANCGHNPPVLVRHGGSPEYLPKSRSMGLAVMEGMDFPVDELTLIAGDSLLLYTDGVTEATDIDGSLYGDPRLLAEMATLAPGFAATDVAPHLLKSIRAFERGAAQADDITLVTLRYLGQQ